MSKPEETNGTPPTGFEWGERTTQSVRHRAPLYWQSDAYEIGHCFGIPDLDVDAFANRYEGHEKPLVYPDMIVHEKSGDRTPSNKGTDALIKGDRDAGKSTFARSLARQLMRENGELVVWRGRSGGSGWLPFKPWTTLFLPAHADVTPEWQTESDQPIGRVEDLADVVRDVYYYSDVHDLLDELGEVPDGSFCVVYPDPSFAGCRRATRESDRVAGELPFVAEWETDDPSEETPIIHWWFAFVLARVEHGPFRWMSLLFDEAGDLMPEGASQAESRLHDKIQALRGSWAASRKRLLSLYFFIHHEENIHHDIRREFKWRVHMPDGSSNPVSRRLSSHPIGFKGDIPMKADIMSEKDPGIGLCYDKNRFTHFRWANIPHFTEDRERWLKIRLEAPAEPPTRTLDVDEDDGPTLEFDEAILREWSNQHGTRLYVCAPGNGYVQVEPSVEIGADLESPVEALVFEDDLALDAEAGVYELRMRNRDDESIVVARIPRSTTSTPPSETGGVGA